MLILDKHGKTIQPECVQHMFRNGLSRSITLSCPGCDLTNPFTLAPNPTIEGGSSR